MANFSSYSTIAERTKEMAKKRMRLTKEYYGDAFICGEVKKTDTGYICTFKVKV